MNKMYSELDKSSDVKKRKVRRDRFAYFKRYKRKDKRITSSRYGNISPGKKRYYRPKASIQNRHHTTDDLYDNANSTSLWTNLDSDNHLFTQDRKKQNGDIVVVNVFKQLKNQITLELRRAFPTLKKKKKNASKTPASTATSGAAPAPTTAASNNESKGDKVFDRISSVVVDQINRDHLLIRGRKNLIYKGRKRTVEIEALVARRSITTNDTIDSGEILESYIEVLR